MAEKYTHKVLKLSSQNVKVLLFWYYKSNKSTLGIVGFHINQEIKESVDMDIKLNTWLKSRFVLEKI